MTEVLRYAQDDMVPMIFVLVASLCSRAAQAQSTAAIAFVDSTVMPAQRRDTAALRRMSDEHFVFVHSTGRAQKLEEFLAFVVQGRQDSIRVLDSPEVHDAGSTVYVVTHTASWAPGRGWTPFSSTDVVVRSSAGLRWLGHQSTALPATATFIAIDQSVGAAVAGRYVSAQGVVRDVRGTGDRLIVRVVGGATVRYGALTPTTFHADGGDAFLVFVRDERGRVTSMEVLQGVRADRYERSPP